MRLLERTGRPITIVCNRIRRGRQGNDDLLRMDEVPVIDVFEEILHADGRLMGKQLHREGAVGSFKSDHKFLP